jgi:hypothetical protein
VHLSVSDEELVGRRYNEARFERVVRFNKHISYAFWPSVESQHILGR